MKTKLLAILLLAGAPLFARVHVAIGIGVGAPVYGYPAYGYSAYGYYVAPPPPVVTYAAPVGVAPYSGYTWVGGYYYPVGARWAWHRGYWARPPYRGAYWVAPRYYGHRWYRGYWRR